MIAKKLPTCRRCGRIVLPYEFIADEADIANMMCRCPSCGTVKGFLLNPVECGDVEDLLTGKSFNAFIV